jgi:hypothetical protein
MYVVIPVSSKCGARLEAHVVPTKGTHGPGDPTMCPDCGERLALPYTSLSPLVRPKHGREDYDMNTTTLPKDPHPGSQFMDALRLLDERFPEGSREYNPVSGEVFISLPLRDGGTFRAGLSWQQAKHLAYSQLVGDDLKDGLLPPDWPR